MDHVEYLKKVAMAKKHRKEYEGVGNAIIIIATISVFIGIYLVPNVGCLFTLMLLAIVLCAIGLIQDHCSIKKFEEKFPEENQIIAEHEELLKGK
jgi:uncharacterized membrane protein YdcZ (DUF606 family)